MIAFGFAGGIVLAAWFGFIAFAVPLCCGLILTLCLHFPKQSWLALTALICGLLWLLVSTPVWPGAYEARESHLRVIGVETTQDASQVVVKVLGISGRALPPWNKVQARLTICQASDIEVGAHLSGVLNWQKPRPPLNPGEFNYSSYLQRQGILATAFVGDLKQLTYAPSTNRFWRVRETLITRASRLGGPAGELLGTLTLGTKAGAWAESWRLAGLAHVLSISGLHIGLILLSLQVLLQACRLTTKTASLFASIFLLFYGCILGPRPAVWRAIIMAIVGMLAVTTKRVRDWPSALALAAIILLCYNPWYLWDAGWQLSFAATIGLLYLSPRIKEHLPVLPWRLDWLLSASLAAQIATLPLVLYHFYLVAPLATVFNILLAPFLPVVLILGLFYLLVPFLGFLLLPVLKILCSVLLSLVDWFATWPLASVSPGAPPRILLLLYLVLLLLAFSYRSQWRRYWATALVVVSLSLLVWQPLWRFVGNNYNFCVLSVGQGAAAALHLPGGEALLFDVGGGFDASGTQVIVPYLRYRGTWRIGAIYLSHLHEDHVVGLAAVLSAFPVERVYVPCTSLFTPAYSELAMLLQAYDLKAVPWSLGDSAYHQGVRIDALNPLPGEGEDENEDSLVLALQWPNLSILVPGDIGQRESSLLPYLPRELDILLVPHHGSGKSSSRDFLQTLQARHAIISTGRNLYGHPAQAVLERLQQHDATIWRTDHHGAITIINNHYGHRVTPFLQP